MASQLVLSLATPRPDQPATSHVMFLPRACRGVPARRLLEATMYAMDIATGCLLLPLRLLRRTTYLHNIIGQ